MLKYGKTAFRIAAFLLVLVGCVRLLGWYFTPTSNEELYAYDSGGIYAEPENTIDVLVIGSSNASRDITPMQWYQNYGVTGYTFGIGAGSIVEVYYALQKIYRTQTPKVVVLCADTVYNTDDNKTVLESTLYDINSAVIPLWEYHNNWRGLRADNLVRVHDFTWLDYDKGFTPQTGCVAMDATWFMTDTDEAMKVPKPNDFYTQAVRRMCSAHGSSFMMITLPAKDWTMSRHLGMLAYTEKYDIPYIDYNLSESGVSIDWGQDTYDAGFHLNYVGALKVTNHLGNVITQFAALPDHRTDPAYIQWKNDLTEYQKEQNQQLQSMAETVPSALEYLTATG